MTVLAVQTYFAQQAATASVQNTIWQRLVGFDQFPKADDPDMGPCIVVVGRYKRKETRLRGNRGAGTKQFAWTQDLLVQATDTDSARGGRAFSTLVENVCQVFRTGPGAATVTDPVTGEASGVTHIGENIDVANNMPISETDPPIELTFIAVVTLTFVETAQPY